LLLRQLVI